MACQAILSIRPYDQLFTRQHNTINCSIGNIKQLFVTVHTDDVISSNIVDTLMCHIVFCLTRNRDFLRDIWGCDIRLYVI